MYPLLATFRDGIVATTERAAGRLQGVVDGVNPTQATPVFEVESTADLSLPANSDYGSAAGIYGSQAAQPTSSGAEDNRDIEPNRPTAYRISGNAGHWAPTEKEYRGHEPSPTSEPTNHHSSRDPNMCDKPSRSRSSCTFRYRSYSGPASS